MLCVSYIAAPGTSTTNSTEEEEPATLSEESTSNNTLTLGIPAITGISVAGTLVAIILLLVLLLIVITITRKKKNTEETLKSSQLDIQTNGMEFFRAGLSHYPNSDLSMSTSYDYPYYDTSRMPTLKETNFQEVEMKKNRACGITVSTLSKDCHDYDECIDPAAGITMTTNKAYVHHAQQRAS